MGVPRKLLFLVVVVTGSCVLVLFALRLLKSDYLYFLENRDQKYYAELARACDSLRMHYPLGTNQFIRIPGTNPSLPRVIRDLQPGAVTVSSNRVHLVVGIGRGGFGISWEKSQTQTNVWVMNAFGGESPKVAYAERR